MVAVGFLITSFLTDAVTLALLKIMKENESVLQNTSVVFYKNNLTGVSKDVFDKFTQASYSDESDIKNLFIKHRIKCLYQLARPEDSKLIVNSSIVPIIHETLKELGDISSFNRRVVEHSIRNPHPYCLKYNNKIGTSIAAVFFTSVISKNIPLLEVEMNAGNDLSCEQKSDDKRSNKYIRIKMLCNWCSSKDLCTEWSNMCDDAANKRWKNIEMVSTDDNIDYYVIINYPQNNSYFNPSKTIIFQMEPWIYNLTRNWGVKTWGQWAEPSPKQFLAVRGRKTEHHNNAFWQLELTYNQLMNLTVAKTGVISTICSSKYFDEGHIARIDLLKYIEGKNDPDVTIDYFNSDNEHKFQNYRGPVSPYIDKSKGMLPYKYYFMIENNYERNFITEKIWEPILCESLVFYYGCPNVSDYIDSRAFVLLDITDFEKCYQTIKQAIAEDWWSQRIDVIREEKKKILNKLSFFPVIEQIITDDICGGNN